MHKIQIEEEYNDDYYEDYMPRLKFEQNQEENLNEASSSDENAPSIPSPSDHPRIFIKGIPQQ